MSNTPAVAVRHEANMTEHERALLRELIEAAKPFLSGDVVDETSGTIPLMERLREAIESAETLEAEKG